MMTRQQQPGFPLAGIPDDRPAVLLLRHAERPEIPPGETGAELALTEAGVQSARGLGKELGAKLLSLSTSPVRRCVETAEAINDGAGLALEPLLDRHLGDPGVYVTEPENAWKNWQRLGHPGVMKHLVEKNTALEGMRHPKEAAHMLLVHMKRCLEGASGIHVFVTHDAIMAPTVSRLLEEPLGREFWPVYLESAAFWREEESIVITYRSFRRCI